MLRQGPGLGPGYQLMEIFMWRPKPQEGGEQGVAVVVAGKRPSLPGVKGVDFNALCAKCL